jgi:hypothetical protein
MFKSKIWDRVLSESPEWLVEEKAVVRRAGSYLALGLDFFN